MLGDDQSNISVGSNSFKPTNSKVYEPINGKWVMLCNLVLYTPFLQYESMAAIHTMTSIYFFQSHICFSSQLQMLLPGKHTLMEMLVWSTGNETCIYFDQ